MTRYCTLAVSLEMSYGQLISWDLLKLLSKQSQTLSTSLLAGSLSLTFVCVLLLLHFHIICALLVKILWKIDEGFKNKIKSIDHDWGLLVQLTIYLKLSKITRQKLYFMRILLKKLWIIEFYMPSAISLLPVYSRKDWYIIFKYIWWSIGVTVISTSSTCSNFKVWYMLL